MSTHPGTTLTPPAADAVPRRARRRVWWAVAVVLLVASLPALALDLHFRGLAWQALWQVTGEEEPLAQLRGATEWVGRAFRAQPQLARDVQVAGRGGNPYGINTFLEQEVEPAKRERSLQMIADAGYGWVRQEFPWEDIEIHAKGDFDDRRNVDAIGVVSAWAKYDHIVDSAEAVGLQLLVRLSNPPTWAQPPGTATAQAPPADVQDYADFATVVAARYQGRITHYQVWNEPNIYPEWGDNDPSPEGYAALLCAAYDALKAVDPAIVVVSAPLAPTNAMGGRNLNDLIFVERLYAAGAGRCFDIMSVQGYGLNSGPTDRRLRLTTINVNRIQYIRDLMVRHGDAHKPVWISEAAWNPVPDEAAAPGIAARDTYGRVSPEQAAAYLPAFYDRVQREWPWVGVTFAWYFKRASDAEQDQSWYYFRLVEPDFTPTPTWAAMRAYIAANPPALRAGTYQEDVPILGLVGLVDKDDMFVADGHARGGQAALVQHAAFRVHGTQMRLRWRSQSQDRFEYRLTLTRANTGTAYTRTVYLHNVRDLDQREPADDGNGWHISTVALAPAGGPYDVRLDQQPMSHLNAILLDEISVADNRWRNILLPLPLTALACTIMAWVLLRAVWGWLVTMWRRLSGGGRRRRRAAEADSA